MLHSKRRQKRVSTDEELLARSVGLLPFNPQLRTNADGYDPHSTYVPDSSQRNK